MLSVSPITVGSDRAHSMITDLTISFCSTTNPSSSCTLEPTNWHRIEKDLYLHSPRRTGWLLVAWAEDTDLTAENLVITDVRIGQHCPNTNSDSVWESRPGGIWVLRSNYTSGNHQAVTGLDVLYGIDAVDPRPQWTLLQQPICLDTDTVDPRPQWTLLRQPVSLGAQQQVPVARLSVRHGSAKPRSEGTPITLKVREDGKFKIVQISDTHMVTGVGVCQDAMDANGQYLPKSEADPLTVKFMGEVLDVEKPDLVILSGDQLHHDILDSQSALFKVTAPLIERSIPYAAIFGNHDDEGSYALSREAQMSLLHGLPFSLSKPGPKQVDGVGNYYLQVFSRGPVEVPLSTLYFLDSHGQASSIPPGKGYDWIKQSQIDWFTGTSQLLRKEREKDTNLNYLHLSLAFQHIPSPEFGDTDLIIRGGNRGEPTEGPKFNSGFYDALANEGIVAVGCGHDHVNDFCGLRPVKNQTKSNSPQLGPWLCYAGGGGFGGYGSYGKKRYYRRMRVWEFNTTTGSLKTWKRVEYAGGRVDELLLVEAGVVVAPSSDTDEGVSGISS